MSTQKIALFGTSGEAMQRVATEALRRGHTVTAIITDEKEFPLKHPNLKVVKGDMRKKEDVRKYAQGHDVVISTHTPRQTNPQEHVTITRTLIEGLKGTGIHSLLSVAQPQGQPAERTEKEFKEFKSVLNAQEEALQLFENQSELKWGYLYAAEPKEKAGKYPTPNELLFASPEGEWKVPVKDYASAVIEEVENAEMELHEGEEEGREY